MGRGLPQRLDKFHVKNAEQQSAVRYDSELIPHNNTGPFEAAKKHGFSRRSRIAKRS